MSLGRTIADGLTVARSLVDIYRIVRASGSPADARVTLRQLRRIAEDPRESLAVRVERIIAEAREVL